MDSPKNIAHQLFTKLPGDPLSKGLELNSSDTSPQYAFEILITILLEGLSILSNDFTTIDKIQLTHIDSASPYFTSMGIVLNVEEYHISEIELYNKQYCRILLNKGVDEGYFLMKNIDEPYHFLLNGTYYDENESKTAINELHAIYIDGDTVFKIKFDLYKDTRKCSQTAFRV